jgi:hypothetical protein
MTHYDYKPLTIDTAIMATLLLLATLPAPSKESARLVCCATRTLKIESELPFPIRERGVRGLGVSESLYGSALTRHG